VYVSRGMKYISVCCGTLVEWRGRRPTECRVADKVKTITTTDGVSNGETMITTDGVSNGETLITTDGVSNGEITITTDGVSNGETIITTDGESRVRRNQQTLTGGGGNGIGGTKALWDARWHYGRHDGI